VVEEISQHFNNDVYGYEIQLDHKRKDSELQGKMSCIIYRERKI
jgi:hypothetical protein